MLKKRKVNLQRLKKYSEEDLQLLDRLNAGNLKGKLFIKRLIKLNPYFWDYGYLIEIEYLYLKGLRETLLDDAIFVGYERECQRIQTCLNLLDIIRGKKSCEKLCIPPKDVKIKDIQELIANYDWKITKYVNTKNAKRFIDSGLLDKLDKPHVISETYNQKAWKLYHKMREYWLRHWWDLYMFRTKE